MHLIALFDNSYISSFSYTFLENASGIEIHERLGALDNVLRSKQQKYIYDLLSFSRSLRYLRGADCPVSLLNNCICVQTLSYLAHYRTLNDGSALPFQVFFPRNCCQSIIA